MKGVPGAQSQGPPHTSRVLVGLQGWCAQTTDGGGVDPWGVGEGQLPTRQGEAPTWPLP